MRIRARAPVAGGLTAFAMLLAAAVATAAVADDGLYGAEHQRCAGGGGSTAEIVDCLGQLTRDWDRRLNAAYRELMRDNPQAGRLREAQRLWIAYRDANCSYYGSGDGSIVRVRAAACLRAMTRQRALELEELLGSG